MDSLVEQAKLALHGIWRRRWLALAVAWGVCLVGWLVLSFIPNRYESSAKVSVEAGLLSESLGVTSTERQAELERIRQTLTSTPNLEKVIRKTDLNRDIRTPADMAAAVAKLSKAVEVKVDNQNTFVVTASASEPGRSDAENARLATAVVRGIIDLFVEGGLAGDQARSAQSIEILDGELRRLQGQLADAEARRVQFETQNLGLLPGQGSPTAWLSAARLELGQVDQQLAAANASVAALRAQLGSTPETIQSPNLSAGGGGAGDPAAAQLAALEAQLAQAQARGWTDQHPDIVATRQQIARTRGQVRRGGTASRGGAATLSTPNPAHASLRATLAEKQGQAVAAATRRAQLQSEIAAMTARQADEPGVTAQAERLTRDYDVLKRQYDKLLEDRERTRLRSDVASKSEALRFQIIDPPSPATTPAFPNRPLLLTAVLLLGLGAGVAVAFLAGQLRNSFSTARRLAEVTGLPVLGTISEVVSPRARADRRRQLGRLAGAGGALGLAWAVLMLVEFVSRAQVA